MDPWRGGGKGRWDPKGAPARDLLWRRRRRASSLRSSLRAGDEELNRARDAEEPMNFPLANTSAAGAGPAAGPWLGGWAGGSLACARVRVHAARCASASLKEKGVSLDRLLQESPGCLR